MALKGCDNGESVTELYHRCGRESSGRCRFRAKASTNGRGVVAAASIATRPLLSMTSLA